MNAPSHHPAQTSTPTRVPEGVREAMTPASDDDFALGWECANPALQIEVWGREADAQTPQRYA